MENWNGHPTLKERTRINSISEQLDELLIFHAIMDDATGARLQALITWAGLEADDKTLLVTFQKTFTLGTFPPKARLSIFGEAHYILWINGFYLDRAPNTEARNYRPATPGRAEFFLHENLCQSTRTVTRIFINLKTI